MATNARDGLVQACDDCGFHIQQQIVQAQELRSNHDLGLIVEGVLVRLRNLQRDLSILKETVENRDITAIKIAQEVKIFCDAAAIARRYLDFIRSALDTVGAGLQGAKDQTNDVGRTNTILLSVLNDRISEYADQLKSLLPTLSQTGLPREIKRFRRQYDEQKDIFIANIRNLPVELRQGTFNIGRRSLALDFGTQGWFWSALPPLYTFKDGEKHQLCVQHPDTGDGTIITKDQVDKARTVLCRLRDAWKEVRMNDPPFDESLVNNLEKMPKIAMVLRGLEPTRRSHFNGFLEWGVHDSNMDSNPYSGASEARLGLDVDYIAAQYSRVRNPNWTGEKRLELRDEEPLPLLRLGRFKETHYSTVDKVRDAWSPDTEYALKRMKPSYLSSNSLDEEVKTLDEVWSEDHGHHFVKCAKTYKRGADTGMLLVPVANENFDDFLQQCARNSTFRRQHRPALLRSLGCLAYSLCYLHNIKYVRHRDVKPHNILCLRAPNQEMEFIWSDFGSACIITQGALSGTHDSSFGATPEYEAPEIKQGKKIWHGRSTDVFSFGCVILEVASILAMDETQYKRRVPIQDLRYYKEHLPDLGTWINTTLEKAKERRDDTLKEILNLASNMISEDPTKRKKIGEVTLVLWAISDKSNSDPHLFCDSCVEKFKQDRSRHAKHPGIFEYRPRRKSSAAAGQPDPEEKATAKQRIDSRFSSDAHPHIRALWSKFLHSTDH